MTFPKHHGLALAKNSWIQNLQVESLAQDPTVFEAGSSRIWYSETDSVLKFVTRNGQGAAVVQVVQDKASVDAAIATLEAAIVAAGDVDGKIATAVGVETAARIAALSAQNIALLASISDAIADEVTARDAAILVAATNAADATATETAARLAGDAALGGRVDTVQAELNATQAGAGLDVDGDFVPVVGSNYIDTATSIAAQAPLLDAALKTEETTRLGQVAALQSAIANETQARIDGDAALVTQIQAYVDGQIGDDEAQDQIEVAARIAADAALQTELDQTQASIGLDTDGQLIPINGTNYMDGATTVFGAAVQLDLNIKRVDDGLTSEIAARVADTAAATAALQAEVTARGLADTAQQTELNTIEAGAGLEADGTYAAPTGTNYLNAATSLKDADLKLDTQVKVLADAISSLTAGSSEAVDAVAADLAQEVLDREAGDTAEAALRVAGDQANASAISAEVTRAQAAEATLATAIDDETTRAQGAESDIAASVTAEVARAEAAELVLTNAVAAEELRATAVEEGLDTRVASLEAGGGTTALVALINATKFRYTSPTAELEHVIAHNLNAEYVSVQVWVQDADDIFRIAILPTEETDSDTITLTLSEARVVKVIVTNEAAISYGV